MPEVYPDINNSSKKQTYENSKSNHPDHCPPPFVHVRKRPDSLEEAEFRVVAVSTDDARFTAKARSLAQGRGWGDFTLLFDKNQEFMRAMNVTLTPQVYVVDKDGKIVYSHTGYSPGSENELLKKIKELKK